VQLTKVKNNNNRRIKQKQEFLKKLKNTFLSLCGFPANALPECCMQHFVGNHRSIGELD
jgi:hypothetical protein